MMAISQWLQYFGMTCLITKQLTFILELKLWIIVALFQEINENEDSDDQVSQKTN